MADPRLKRLAKLKALALNNPSEEEARSAAVAALKLEREIAGERPTKQRADNQPLTYEEVMQARERAAQQQEAHARQAEERYQEPRQGPTYRQYGDPGYGAPPPSPKDIAERLVAELEKRIQAEISVRLTQAVAEMQKNYDRQLKDAQQWWQESERSLRHAKAECKALQCRLEELDKLLFEATNKLTALEEAATASAADEQQTAWGL